MTFETVDSRTRTLVNASAWVRSITSRMPTRRPTRRPMRNCKVKYPHLRRAAREMGYNYSYLYRVLEGQYKGRAGLREEFWAASARIAEQKGGAL